MSTTSSASLGNEPEAHPAPLTQSPPIQAAILDRLAHVARRQGCGALEIGDGAGDLENPVVRPGGEREPGDRSPQQRIGAIGDAAEGADVAWGHVRVGVDPGAAREAVALHGAGPIHPLAHRLTPLAPALIGEGAALHRRYLEVDVDAVE